MSTERCHRCDEIIIHAQGRNPLAGDFSGKRAFLEHYGRVFAELEGSVELAEVHDVLVDRERAIALVNERAVRGAAHEIHSERHGEQTFTLGTHLPLEEAGQRTGIRPNSIRYHDAIEELEYEGAIEWAASARYAKGDKHYVITQPSLEDAG